MNCGPNAYLDPALEAIRLVVVAVRPVPQNARYGQLIRKVYALILPVHTATVDSALICRRRASSQLCVCLGNLAWRYQCRGGEYEECKTERALTFQTPRQSVRRGCPNYARVPEIHATRSLRYASAHRFRHSGPAIPLAYIGAGHRISGHS